jgi:hypothetical protein
MVNILDRSDRSLSPVPRANGRPAMIPKRSKNDWSLGGKPGRFCMIDKNELNIDGRYQRGQVSETKVREIARNWDWVLLGVILVVQRLDGTYWVFDGGHRTRGSFYRDDIQMLPCMVYSIDDLSDEAKAFLGKNLMVTNVSSVDKYKAAVVANDETANKASALLGEFGIEVSFNASKTKQIKCINTLLSMIDRDEALAKRCFVFCLGRSEGSPVSSTVMRGLFALCQRLSDRVDVLEKFGEKLARHNQREMEVRIRQMRAECGKGGEKVEALALLSLINKGCKNKLSW